MLKLIFMNFKSYLEVNFQEKSFATIETRWYSFWNKFHNVGKNAKGENLNSTNGNKFQWTTKFTININCEMCTFK
jgi:hypothetical protein